MSPVIKMMRRVKSGRSLTISDGGEPERYVGGLVSWSLFPLLGVEPVLGHGFSADDDRPGGGSVFWFELTLDNAPADAAPARRLRRPSPVGPAAE